MTARDPEMPVISCLSITGEGRLPLLRGAIEDFCQQTYPNRELLVVVGGTHRIASEIQAYVNSLERDDIRVLQARDDLPLGALRNLSIDEARGDILCQWDDDDRYHRERLALQFAALVRSGASACFLHEQLYYFADQASVYWVDWRYYRGWRLPLKLRTVIPGTVLWCRSEDRYPDEGPEAHTGEDTVFSRRLARHSFVGVPEAGHCYLRVFHGQNCWARNHHERNVRLRGRSRRQLLRERATVEAALTAFDLPQLRVMGRDGFAFVTSAR